MAAWPSVLNRSLCLREALRRPDSLCPWSSNDSLVPDNRDPASASVSGSCPDPSIRRLSVLCLVPGHLLPYSLPPVDGLELPGIICSSLTKVDLWVGLGLDLGWKVYMSL